MQAPATVAALPDNLSMPDSPVIPVLQYADVPDAVIWLCRAFGFSERLRIGSHRVQMATGAMGGYVVVAAGGSAERKAAANSSVIIRIRNADEHHAAAKLAGAEILHPPETYPYGERQYSATDPGGHVWTFSETVANVNPGDWGGVLVQR